MLQYVLDQTTLSVRKFYINSNFLHKELPSLTLIVNLYHKRYFYIKGCNIPPVTQPARKIPYAKYDQLKATVEQLEEETIIAPTNKPSD